jgi:hypothetical protein
MVRLAYGRKLRRNSWPEEVYIEYNGSAVLMKIACTGEVLKRYTASDRVFSIDDVLQKTGNFSTCNFKKQRVMKISYENSTLADYATISYCVTIHNEDDSVHFPVYEFTGYIFVIGDDVYKSDYEIYEMVINHMKTHLMDRYGYTFEEMEADPAFKDINIRVSKELYYSKQINFTK